MRVVTAALAGLMLMGGAADARIHGKPEDIVAGRRAGMALAGAALGSMKSAMDGGAAARTQAFAAGAVARWGQAIPGMFPAGTDPEAMGELTHAKAEVWSQRADFEAKAAALATEAGKLAELARADDAAGFTAQWTVVRATCQSCHATYKAE